MADRGTGGAAELLGLRPSTLRSRIKKHGLRRPVDVSVEATTDAEGRLRLAAVLVLLAVGGAAVWMAVAWGSPFPPRTISMATGPDGGAYQVLGERYREILRRSGVDLRVVPTAGGVDNLARLRDEDSGVSVAFLESGLTDQEVSPDLASLGTVSFEPLWFFLRSGTRQGAPRQLQGKRISIEPEGSATRVLALRLLALNGVDQSNAVLVGLPPERSAEALLRGEIDGALMLTSWHSPVVRRLLVADGIVLQGYPRADAYVALFPSLSKVVLPTGVADLEHNIPPSDVTLLAVEASLVARKDLNPAIQYLLLAAAAEIHGGPEIFDEPGRFPAAEAVDLPLSQPAPGVLRVGVPFVYRVLPAVAGGHHGAPADSAHPAPGGGISHVPLSARRLPVPGRDADLPALRSAQAVGAGY